MATKNYDEEDLVDFDETLENEEVEQKETDKKGAKEFSKKYVGIHSSSFKDFVLKPELMKAIADCGFEHPSEVQHECIPQAILGMDVLCQAQSGIGKCWGPGTEFLMFDGSVKNVEHLAVGDKLMGDDNKPRTIGSLVNGIGPMFKIVPLDQSPAKSFTCNDEHILVLKCVGSPRVVDQSEKSCFEVQWLEQNTDTNMLQEKSQAFAYASQDHQNRESAHNAALLYKESVHDVSQSDFIWEVPVKEFLQAPQSVQERCVMYSPGVVRFPTEQGFLSRTLSQVLGTPASEEQVSASAWLIGLWIGSGKPERGSVKVSTEEIEIAAEFHRATALLNCGTKTSAATEKSIELVSGDSAFSNLLHSIGLTKTSHAGIPHDIIIDDHETVRLPILAGIIDASGIYEKGFQIFENDKNTAETIARIANLSGFRCNGLNETWKDSQPGVSKPQWNMVIDGPALHSIPTISPHKNAPFTATKETVSWGFHVESLGDDQYHGFTVDGNRRMLLSDLTVTHNTAVFVLSVMQQLDPIPGQVQCLVLCHTRELAFQIASEFTRFSKYLPDIKNGVFYGGIPIDTNKKLLNSEVPNIVVGTPGRILQLAREGDLDLSKIRHFVLDECDKMLESMNMRNDVQEIFKRTPRDKQVMMFSATLDKSIRPIAKKFMNDPMEIYVDDESKLTLHGLQQYYINLTEREKNKKLNDLLEALEYNQVVIFVRSITRASELNKLLVECNYPSVCVHSKMTQEQRIDVYSKFKKFEHRVLVSTDLFGRGIDIQRVNVVINYDMPEDPDQYLHRVGRAGRFGTSGLAISFISTDAPMTYSHAYTREHTDQAILDKIQSRFEVKIQPLPDKIDVSTYMSS